jgi:hypothetical protein
MSLDHFDQLHFGVRPLDLLSVYGVDHLEYKLNSALLIILTGLHRSFCVSS